MKKLFACLPVAALLPTAGALAEEGVRVAGSKLPYIIGGVAAIAIGVVFAVVMVASKEGRAVIITPTGLPIPMPLIPVLIGVAIGLKLINTTPQDSYTLNGLRYKLDKEAAYVVGFAEDAEIPEVLELPGEVEGLPLTSVGGFEGTDLRQAVLPLSVTRIDSKAFKDCAKLETVRIEGDRVPDSENRLYLSVGNDAFAGCGALKNLSLLKAREVGNRAFMGCASLARAELPGAYAGVGAQAFSGCTALESVTLSGDIQKIGAEAFAGCGALKSLRLEGGETAQKREPGGSISERRDEDKLVVGARAFENCAALVSVDFPAGDNTKSIGERAFAGCAALDIEVPAAHLEKYCFEGCASLRSVATNHVWAIETDRRTVPEGAFKDCTGLVVADLRGIRTVGAGAFENCPSLRQVTATWVEKVGQRAFARCPALEVFGVAGVESATLKKLATDAFEGSENAVLYDGGDAKLRSLAEAAGVKTDGGWWFECELLPDGTLRLFDWPHGGGEVTGAFTVPGEWAGLPVSAVGLYNSYSHMGHEFPLRHEEIIVEEGVRTLEEDCFGNWEATLRRITLPDSLEAIDDYRKAIVSDSDDMTVCTANPVAIEYAERMHWTVVEP